MAGARVTGDDLRAYRDALRSDSAQGGDVAAIRDRVEATARGTWFIDALYRHEDLLAGARPDTFAVLFRNSQYPGRTKGTLSRLGIMERQTEGTLMSDGAPYGTSHGSAYWYDRHVPLVFYGAGVRAGRSDEAVRTVDAAPSLAALAGISAPDDLDGRALVSR
jgi:arylsulfatase A-like enzyme